MSSHIFVDETKRRGYLLVAGVVLPEDLDPIRRILRGPVLPGQRRLHMKDESDPRKRSIATAVAVSGVQAASYTTGLIVTCIRCRGLRAEGPDLLHC